MPPSARAGGAGGAAGTSSRLAVLLGGLAGAALAVSLVTALSRAVGAVRVAVLGQTVGPTCLGDTYATANLVPNVVFEVVAGGALASLVVPVLAGPLAAGDTATARRTASALLTWTVLLLVPLALLLAVASRPAMALLLGEPAAGCDGAAQLEVGARMLAVFAPQVVLYGVALVLGGVLQAHRRFLGPALAPLLSSLVVIATFLVHAAQTGRGERPLVDLGLAEELTLSVGTTLGVAALALPLLVPVRRTGLRLAPTLTFPPGIARRARGLALAGSVVLVTQQASVVVALRLLNDVGPRGSVVLYTLATTVFIVPWAVLAVPISTSAFPRLAEQADRGDTTGFARTAAQATRAVLLVSAASAAVLLAAAGPAARVLVETAPGRASVDPLTDALVAFAPGLLGYGLVAVLGRSLYARGAGRAAATATGIGWAVVAVADVVLVTALPPDDAVRAVGLGHTVGMTVAGLLLLRALRRVAGPEALAGVLRTLAVATAAGLVAAIAGSVAVGLAGTPDLRLALATGAGAAVVVLVVFVAAVAVGDRDLTRAALARLRARRSRNGSQGSRGGRGAGGGSGGRGGSAPGGSGSPAAGRMAPRD